MLPDFRLESFFDVWEFTARYNLCASDAQTMALSELLALAGSEDRAAWERLTLGYIPVKGTPELREAIAQTYECIEPADVLCFAGAEEGLYCAMHGLLGSGDHAIVAVPNYQSTESVPRSICDVTGVALREQSGWNLDLDEIAAALRPNTRLIAVNFPHNPTGKIVSPQMWDSLVELCRARGLYLFSDEVYRGIERDPRKRLAQAADRYERALSLNVFSKAYGLPGLRIGWIACRDKDAIERMAGIKHYLSICNAAPSEVLARMALAAATPILSRNRSICAENLALLRRFFARHAERFEWYEPDGGCVAFPRYLGGDVEAFCNGLAERAGVLLLPASAFKSDLLPVARDRFRIGYGRRGMEEGLAALEQFLERGA